MSQRNDNAPRPLITALPFPRILLASLLAAALAACGGAGDSEPNGAAGGAGGIAGNGGTGASGGDAGNAGSSGTGGTGEWPVPSCEEMCSHIYDDCGLGFLDPAGGDLPEEDCVSFCHQEPPPDEEMICFAHMECTLDAMHECIGR